MHVPSELILMERACVSIATSVSVTRTVTMMRESSAAIAKTSAAAIVSSGKILHSDRDIVIANAVNGYARGLLQYSL